MLSPKTVFHSFSCAQTVTYLSTAATENISHRYCHWHKTLHIICQKTKLYPLVNKLDLLLLLES